MKIVIKILKGIFWIIFAWQVITLIPVLTWVQNLSGVTGNMWAKMAIKLTILIICYALYEFLDKKYKAMPATKDLKKVLVPLSLKYPLFSVAVFLLVIIVINSFGASNYNDCILDNLSAGMSGNAVSAVKSACRSKFRPSKRKIKPEPTPKILPAPVIEFKEPELTKIEVEPACEDRVLRREELVRIGLSKPDVDGAIIEFSISGNFSRNNLDEINSFTLKNSNKFPVRRLEVTYTLKEDNELYTDDLRLKMKYKSHNPQFSFEQLREYKISGLSPDIEDIFISGGYEAICN